MKGVIANCLEEFVNNRFGKMIWQKALEDAGLKPMTMFLVFDDIDDALIEGLSQNQDFFSMLLSNDEMKQQVLGIFSDEIYKSLRDAK